MRGTLERHFACKLNKTDRNDAEGLAQIMRTGWFRAVHVKSLAVLRYLPSNC